MSSNESPQSPPPSATPARRHRRRTPPKWVWIVLVLLGVLVAIVRGAEVIEDHALTNIATVLLCFVGIVVAAVWFLFLSGYSWLSRLLVGAGCVAVVAVLVFLFPVERLNGELVPTFRYRYSAEPDRLLTIPPAEAAKAYALIFARQRRTIFPASSARSGASPSITSSSPAIGPIGVRSWFGGKRSGRAGRLSPWSTVMRRRWSSAARWK